MPIPAIGSSGRKSPDSPVCSPRARDLLEVRRLLDLARHFVGELLRGGLRLLVLQRVLDLRAHLGERLRRRRPLVGHLDDVVPELRLHEVAQLADLHRERRLVEFGDHLAAREEVEVATLGGAPLVLRVLPGELGEIGALLDFRQEVLGLLLRRVVLFGLAGRLDQDVAGPHLLGGRVLLDVVVVGALDLLAGDGRLGAQRLLIDRHEPDLPLLADAVGVLVGVEVLRHVVVARVDSLAVLVGGEVDDGELDLLVAFAVLGVDVLVADGDPAGDGGLQLLGDDAAADLVFEVRGPHRRVLHLEDLAVALIADELAAFLEGRQRQDPLADLFVAGADAEAVGFGERRLLLDHLLNDALVDPELFQ
jgi:hypothetical protein